jgi:hypothetical protein
MGSDAASGGQDARASNPGRRSAELSSMVTVASRTIPGKAWLVMQLAHTLVRNNSKALEEHGCGGSRLTTRHGPSMTSASAGTEVTLLQPTKKLVNTSTNGCAPELSVKI